MIFATKDNLKKQIVFTTHAKERMKEYNIERSDLISMLYASELRPPSPVRLANKAFKHGKANDEWLFNDVTIITEIGKRFIVIITVHKK